MMSLLFRNRWFAAGWVALTLVSVSVFAGKDGGAALIRQSADRNKAQRLELATAPEAPPVAARPTFAPDQAMPRLEVLPGSNADPANPQVGDVFVDPLTGKRMRAVRRGDQSSSSSAASPSMPSSSSSFGSPR